MPATVITRTGAPTSAPEAVDAGVPLPPPPPPPYMLPPGMESATTAGAQAYPAPYPYQVSAALRLGSALMNRTVMRRLW